jgi:hypothetical protein
MRKALYILAILLLFSIAVEAQVHRTGLRRVGAGDDMKGRYYYLAMLLLVSAALLFGLGFFLSKIVLPENVTGKYMLVLTWFLVAVGVGWVHMMMSSCPYYFWIRETIKISWPVLLSGLTAGGAFSRLPKGKWIALVPTPLGICGTLMGIAALEPTPWF